MVMWLQFGDDWIQVDMNYCFFRFCCIGFIILLIYVLVGILVLFFIGDFWGFLGDLVSFC